MADHEPTLGELMRVVEAMRVEQRDRHKEITNRMNSLVQSEVFNREVLRLDTAVSTVSASLTTETANRRESVRLVRIDTEKDITEVHTRLDKFSGNLKWMAAAIILPVALFVANLVFAQQGAT